MACACKKTRDGESRATAAAGIRSVDDQPPNFFENRKPRLGVSQFEAAKRVWIHFLDTRRCCPVKRRVISGLSIKQS